MRKLMLSDISPRYLGYDFKDAKALKEYIKTHKVPYDLKEFLNDAQLTVNRARSLVNIPEFDTYENSGLPIDALNRIDRFTKASVLLLTSPFSHYPSTEQHMVGNDSIYDLRHRICHRTRRGGSLVLPAAPTRLEKIEQAIDAYDTQIVDLAKERGILTSDLFFHEIDERCALAKEHQQEIIECLCSIEASPIWGSLSMKQRKYLLSGIKSKHPNVGLEKTLIALAHYMTKYEISHDVERGINKVIKK